MQQSYERLLRNPDALEAYLAIVDSELRSGRALIEILRLTGEDNGPLLAKWHEEQERASEHSTASSKAWLATAGGVLADDGPTDPLYLVRGITHLEILRTVRSAAAETMDTIVARCSGQQLHREELLQSRGRLGAFADTIEQIVRTLRAELRRE